MNYQKILTLIAMIGVFTQMAAKSINVYDISICPGETRDFFIYMNTARSNLVSFQIDLQLPEGLTVNVDKCKLPSRVLQTDADQKLFVGCMDETKNIYRLVSTSYKLNGFSMDDAPLVKVSITASEDFKGGKISLQDMMTVTSDANVVYWYSGDLNVASVPYIECDTDRSGSITVNDVMVIVYYVLDGERLFSSNYDINKDETIDVKDVEIAVSNVLGK